MLMRGYEEGGLTRREYCRQRGIPLTTFDYYRHRRQKKLKTLKKATPPPALVAVELMASGAAPRHPVSPLPMTVVLTNGRRIEVPGGFAEADLARLLRAAEHA